MSATDLTEELPMMESICTFGECEEPAVTMLVMQHFGFTWVAGACASHVTQFMMTITGALN